MLAKLFSFSIQNLNTTLVRKLIKLKKIQYLVLHLTSTHIKKSTQSNILFQAEMAIQQHQSIETFILNLYSQKC